MLNKTKFGVPCFDATFGGVYDGRSVLCCGRTGSGKSTFAMHFLAQVLEDDRKALLLTNAHPHDVLIVADAMGFNFSEAISSGRLTLFEYAFFIPEERTVQNILLPPDAFDELAETIEREAIQRVAFDTVLPWVTIQPVARIQQHVYSFCHAIERLGATTLFTMPKPVSNAAFALRHAIEGFCPVAIELHHRNESSPFAYSVTRYLGESANLSAQFPFHVEAGRGIVAGDAPAPAAEPPQAAPYSPAPATPAPAAPIPAPAPFNPAAPLPIPSLDGSAATPPAGRAPSAAKPGNRPDAGGGFADAIKLPGV